MTCSGVVKPGKNSGVADAVQAVAVQAVAEHDRHQFRRGGAEPVAQGPQAVVDDTQGLDILRAYAARTGRAVLLNTSLNLHGEPIARTAHDAVRVFQRSGLRKLQLGPFLVRK